ncbi:MULTISPECIES: class I SAM-dependent DNA methyltransferase [Mycobacteriaceae]|uniref:Class I SAM-dependent methyltransferase n=1 Tax=Mycolicibacterium parafortuitum TaxID=39692 RepID=A0ACC6MN37_MYCPF|nr:MULTISPECIES: class I SAM-dependent methyltransferase [Mycobacteriaceae]MDZ5088384.1 class I SAM-dependent methyltransferase [Mycolicibacterium parafortuitum]GFM16100.1 type 11 methyltransferase [Mycobacterium sp. PO1]GFM26375.1 type 11 methyltransferase [Mycobacterium sp. PO2]
MGTRWQSSDAPRGQDYDARWERLAASGVGVHGEADLIESLLRETGGSTVLDAGCGTGRVAIELAARGFAVVGLDADPAMLAAARSKAPDLRWVEADLVDTGDHLSEAFDLVALPGNVMIFLDRGTEPDVVGQLAARLRPGGLLVAGFQLQTGRLTLDRYDEITVAAGLQLVDRWATWDREPFHGGDYAVSVHRRPA